MKNSYIALAVFSMAALLVSCETVNEVQNDTFVPTENDVVFNLGYNRIQTKASDADAPVAKVTTFDLGREGEYSFFLEQSVVSLDSYAAGPETKGTPAYTENLGVLYDKLGVYISGGTFPTSESAFARHSETQLEDSGWQYYKDYGYNPWPSSANQAVDIYVRMPYDNSVTISSRTGGKFTFSYTSPESAANQKDILFGYRSAKRSEYEASLPDGLPMLLNHALTGVKFAAGNPDNVTIKSVTLKGLYNTGTCVVTPVSENNYTDVTTNHTSDDEGVVVWTPTTTSTGTFTSGDFSTTLADYSNKTSFGTMGNYPTTFGATGGKNNLNDADASQTFWIIPQAFKDGNNARTGITLTVTYTLPGSTDPKNLEIDLGALLAGRNIEWKAGELWTYTLRIDEVNVRIEDTVTKDPNNTGSTGDPKGILGSTKDAVKITNTGNTDVFIRAAISGQWVLDRDGERVIMFGFTDEINNLYLVESWYEDQFVNHTGEHGVFEGLAGYRNDKEHINNTGVNVNDWVYNTSDRYYYYTLPVAVGADTKPLFESYTVNKIPHTKNSGTSLSQNMYFTLEISTQAINARTSNGTLREDYAQAWIDACGIDDSAVSHDDPASGDDETGDGE